MVMDANEVMHLMVKYSKKMLLFEKTFPIFLLFLMHNLLTFPQKSCIICFRCIALKYSSHQKCVLQDVF